MAKASTGTVTKGLAPGGLTLCTGASSALEQDGYGKEGEGEGEGDVYETYDQTMLKASSKAPLPSSHPSPTKPVKVSRFY